MQSAVDYIGENGNIMIVNPLKNGKEARKVFSFNKVFGSNVTQGMISFLLQNCVMVITKGSATLHDATKFEAIIC